MGAARVADTQHKMLLHVIYFFANCITATYISFTPTEAVFTNQD